MNAERFRHLQEIIGYDNERMAKMLAVSTSEVADYRAGLKALSELQARDLELFADWASEVGDTAVKKAQAEKYLGGD